MVITMLTIGGVPATRRMKPLSVAPPRAAPPPMARTHAAAVGRPRLVWAVQTSRATTVAIAPKAKLTTLEVLKMTLSPSAARA